MKNNTAIMSQTISKVASKMKSLGHPRSNEIERIAQYFGDMSTSNYGGTNMSGQNFGQGIQDFQPMSAGDNIASEGDPESLNPGISSFVKMKPGEEPVVDDRRTHTCTVVFKASEEVSESDMMNYILGISNELGVDVGSFKWSKSDTSGKTSV
jgi:hypothetical protein